MVLLLSGSDRFTPLANTLLGIGRRTHSLWVRFFIGGRPDSQRSFPGGYAVFHPGVYGNGDTFGEILQPVANGKFFIAGDATSACHACVDLLPIIRACFSSKPYQQLGRWRSGQRMACC